MSELLKNEPHYEYPGYGQDVGFCHLLAYKLSDGRILAIVTQPTDNTAASVTNRAEAIFTQLMTDFELTDPLQLIQVEHYAREWYKGREQEDAAGEPSAVLPDVYPGDFDQVQCWFNQTSGQYINPTWSPLSQEEIEAWVQA
jgi:D-alanyl-D-alanine carboxypeptidase